MPDPALRADAMLVANGPLGVEIEIVDAYYRPVARGAEHLEKRLPEGLYYVKWMAGGQTEQRLVRLLPIEKPLAISGGVFENTTAHTVQSLLERLRRPEPGGGLAEILVVARACAANATLSPDVANVRLIDCRDIAMKADARRAETGEDLGAGPDVMGRIYRVSPGAFRLRYLSVTGDTLDQTICAIAGWRIIVALEIAESRALAPPSGSTQDLVRKGVAPAHTMIVAHDLRRETLDFEDIRLAEILLSHLRDRRRPTSAGLYARLLHQAPNPLLNLYAAAAILAAQDEATPSDDMSSEVTADELPMDAAAWIERAAQLLRAGEAILVSTDINPLAWRLEAAGLPFLSDRVLQDPPMLDCAWKWGVERSLINREAMPNTFTLQTAAIGRAEIEPWLVWRSRAAVGVLADAPAVEPPHSAQSSGGDTMRLSESVARLAAFMATSEPEGSRVPRGGAPVQDPRMLSSNMMQAIATRSLYLDKAAGGADLARALRTPAAILESQVQRTLDEMTAPAQPRQKATVAPALSRPVRVKDDPNKGRFGGHPDRDGFRLNATFRPSAPNAGWIETKLVVTADETVGNLSGKDKVVFFLHDTFDPERYTQKFTKKRRAVLDIGSYGGFTVGVWIASRGVELELDLAELPNAPSAIKEW